MKSISRTFLFIGASLLLTLLVLRLGWPEAVVDARAGWALSLSGSFLAFIGLALGVGSKIQTGAIGGALVLASTALGAGSINFILGLGFFKKHPSSQSVEEFFAISTPVMLCFWGIALWRVLRKNSGIPPEH